jgi:tetratricopeptide (TPR) repeat protein
MGAMRVWTLALVLALPGQAFADKDKDRADKLFKQGKKLMAEKRFADACPAFEQSFKLDPAIGGELNVARCYEEWGKLARAYAAYLTAEEMAKEANDSRLAKIRKLVSDLEPQVPHLTVKLPSGTEASAVSVMVDDKPLETSALGQAQLVDPGPHTVAYEVNGAKKKKVVPLERGGSSEITLDVSRPEPVADSAKEHERDRDRNRDRDKDKDKDVEPPPRVVHTRDPGRNQKLAAYATGAAGVVLVGVSSYMTLSARSSYNDALSQHCGGVTTMCDDTGLTLTHDARHEANVATVVFLVGAAAVGAGVVLYVTAPHTRRSEERAWYLAPAVSPTGGAIVLGGKL